MARRNAAINRVAHRIRSVAGNGYRHPTIRAVGPYDLIRANILADPLCELARATARHLAPGGIAVEYGFDGKLIDWENHVPTISFEGDLWGHEYNFPGVNA